MSMVQCHQWCTSGTAGLPKCRGGWTARLSEIISCRANGNYSIDLHNLLSMIPQHARTCPGSRLIEARALVCARSTTTGCRRRRKGGRRRRRAASSGAGLRLGRLSFLVASTALRRCSRKKQLALKVLVPRWRQQVRTLRASENAHSCTRDNVACARHLTHSQHPPASSSNAHARCNHCKKHSHR